jgi:hypothetical protein
MQLITNNILEVVAVASAIHSALCREASTLDKKIGWKGVCRTSSCSWQQ